MTVLKKTNQKKDNPEKEHLDKYDSGKEKCGKGAILTRRNLKKDKSAKGKIEHGQF